MDTVHENFKMAMYGYVSGTMDVAGVVIALEKMSLDYENAAKEVREKISNGTL
jgi:hypothetical protein